MPGSAFHPERPPEGLDPELARANGDGNSDAGGGGVLGCVSESLGADEVSGHHDPLGQLGCS
jgi:hypothetical protein